MMLGISIALEFSTVALIDKLMYLTFMHKEKGLKMKISVITVCYNSVKTLERCIKSVLAQNYVDIEYIIIDGGSLDGTIDIIESYQNYISYWKSEKDSGIYDAMNKGIDVSTGDVIAFLNSDDWYEDNTLNIIDSIFTNSDAQLVCGNVRFHDNNMTRLSDIKCEDLWFIKTYPHPAMFARRDLFLKYGCFNTRYKIAADYDWQLRLFEYPIKIKTIDNVLTNFSYGGISTSSENLMQRLEEDKEIEINAIERSKIHTEEEKNELKREALRHYVNASKIGNFKIMLSKGEIAKNLLIKDVIGKVLDEKEYILFGCGNGGRELVELLFQLDKKVICILDNDSRLWETKYNGIKIINPKHIANMDGSIIISLLKKETEIEKQLKNINGLKKRKCLLYSKLRQEITELLWNSE